MNYEDYFIERGSRFPKYPLNVGLIPCDLTDKALGSQTCVPRVLCVQVQFGSRMVVVHGVILGIHIS